MITAYFIAFRYLSGIDALSVVHHSNSHVIRLHRFQRQEIQHVDTSYWSRKNTWSLVQAVADVHRGRIVIDDTSRTFKWIESFGKEDWVIFRRNALDNYFFPVSMSLPLSLSWSPSRRLCSSSPTRWCGLSQTFHQVWASATTVCNGNNSFNNARSYKWKKNVNCLPLEPCLLVRQFLLELLKQSQKRN